ncbi:hypothetical protein EK21DRAFT_80243 [Setomelanomma holmii]|uniref:Developmental regulatory protein wetA n=1 Tax=Setomelanomma holmii TaxID=210430 RepID=A0A9P4LEV2_9PLEO|nr:hypothetical protein EK21DRAFT_80243 [Setomelanomma holmii]
MRPISDKEVEIVDLDQLFEEYVETDLRQQYSDSAADRSSSDDLAHLFELTSSNESDAFTTSPILDRDADIAWHQAVPSGEQKPALIMSNDASSFHIDARGKEPLSDSELLSFEDLFELERNQLRSISQPSTPRPHTARSVKKAVSFQEKSIPRGIHKSTKRSPAASFAKMMQPSFYRSPIPDVWTRKLETPANSFSMRVASNGITSPPPSSKLMQHENGSGFFTQSHHQHQPYSDDQSPLASPLVNQAEMSFSNDQLTPQASPAIGISNSNNADPFSDNLGLASSSSDSSAALSALQTPPSSLRLPMTTWGPDTSPAMNFGFSASPDFSATKTAGWWDDEAAHHAGPTYRESNSRSTSQNMAFTSTDLGGLGITCDNSSFGDFGVPGLGIGAAEIHSSTAGHRTHSTTRSERRKSSNGSNTSARQASASSGNVGFVNFTPHDSRKILTGVAPSGSSKTKARREKEAAEKRRKLSQAAVKAVMEAGGDVDSLRRLEREELLVLGS